LQLSNERVSRHHATSRHVFVFLTHLLLFLVAMLLRLLVSRSLDGTEGV
jgi:hypothetical protein